MDKQINHFDELVWQYLDASISEEDFARFQHLLKTHTGLRHRYQFLVEVHHGLSQHQNQVTCPQVTGQKSFSFLRLLKRSMPYWLSAAAVFVILLLAVQFSQSPPALDVILASQRGADWRGVQPTPGEKMSTRMMHLTRGTIALRFQAGTSVIIEGPAWFQLLDSETIELSMGTMTVHHQGQPGRFKVITPVGKLTDLGTKFGVSVGDGTVDSVVMTEVYEGELRFENKAAHETPLSLKKGDAYAIVGDHEKLKFSRTFEGMDVKVSANFELAGDDNTLQSTKNLALGKPVYSSTYYNFPTVGETFPPTALTDGRLADTGSPGDWSFWLAPNGSSGSFTVDLQKVETISRIELQNTRNRFYGDRGIEKFKLEVSLDGKTFTPLLEGSLAFVTAHNYKAFQFEKFEFAPAQARFIRLTGLSHYMNNYRPNQEIKDHSGGLNEIRVFK